MIKYGHCDIDIPLAQLENIRYDDYFQCYQQTPQIEKYYTDEDKELFGDRN